MKINPAVSNSYAPNAIRDKYYNESQKMQGEGSGTLSFSDFLKDSVADVNKTQVNADTSVTKLLNGEQGAGMHETMLAVEQADLKMRLMVQVRNKAVEAYREIMRIST